MKRPLPTWRQLGMMAAGGIAGGGAYALLTGNGPEDTYFTTFTAVGVALGATPYAKTMQKHEDALENASDPPSGA